MRKLLRADLFCLRRSRVLWLCMAAAFVISAIFLLRLSTDNENMRTLDDAFLQLLPFLSILHAAFIGLFLGIEYQDGTMRNKLVVGHSRRAVYGAYLITGTVGCFAILLAWAASVVIGVVKFGWFAAPAGTLLLYSAVILLLTAAEAAILTLLCLLVTNRAVSGVAAILLALALLILGSSFYNALCEPETISPAIMTENGFEIGEPEPNPDYISGTLRTVYQFAVDALPSGQAILLANQELARPGLSLDASAGLILLVSAIGMAIFRRKDLK